MTKGNFVVRCGALSNIIFLSYIASFTNLNFYQREDKEAVLSSNTCCKYRTPPWISLVDFELAPDPKSSFSMSKVLMPRVEASSSTPTPLQPPPMTRTSYWGLVYTSARCCFRDLNVGVFGLGWSWDWWQARERERRAVEAVAKVAIRRIL